ncbi:exosporium leader peptide-containing protein, partial [Bacillus cereus]
MSRKDKFNRSRMSRKDRFNSSKIKSEISISPDLVGPTFPPIPSFTLPTGIT